MNANAFDLFLFCSHSEIGELEQSVMKLIDLCLLLVSLGVLVPWWWKTSYANFCN
jgi:hypothetical protein